MPSTVSLLSTPASLLFSAQDHMLEISFRHHSSRLFSPLFNATNLSCLASAETFAAFHSVGQSSSPIYGAILIYQIVFSEKEKSR